MLAAERVAVAGAETGESPLWDAKTGMLWWLDIHGQTMFRYSPGDRSNQAVSLEQPVSAIGLRASGGLLAVGFDGFYTVNTSTGELVLIAPVEVNDSGTRLNDGKCGPDGCFYAGSMDLKASRNIGSFYRLNADRTVSSLFSGTTVSNGLDWSPDGTRFYFVDSIPGTVDVFDRDAATGALGNRRTLVRLDRSLGLPDGICVDSEGWIWVACWRGAAVRRFAPDGTPGAIIQLPVSQVTSCAFGGTDLGDLYITTGKRHLSDRRLHAEKGSGDLFVCRTGHHGQPAHCVLEQP